MEGILLAGQYPEGEEGGRDGDPGDRDKEEVGHLDQAGPVLVELEPVASQRQLAAREADDLRMERSCVCTRRGSQCHKSVNLLATRAAVAPKARPVPSATPPP